MSDGALQQLDDFEIITKLGGGGMADVYLARTKSDAGFEKLVAIKQVQPGMARNERFIKMLLDEARVAASLNHSNIAQVFDLRRAADTYFMIMEYVHGVTLQQVRYRFEKQGTPPPGAMTSYIIAHLCAALEYAHTRSDGQGQSLGIIHRDVSPDNVMISFEGEVKLIDLGIVKAKERLHETRGVLIKGKPSYMSPEQALGSTIDHRTDIYAAGVVLYELLTLKNPRMNVGLVHQGPNLPTGDFSLPSEIMPDVDTQLERICLKALAIDPQNRYQSAGAMERALQDWLKAHPFSRTDLASWLAEEMQPQRARRERIIHGKPKEVSSPGAAKPSTRVVSPPRGYADVVHVGPAGAAAQPFSERTLSGSKSMIFGPAVGKEEERTSQFQLPPNAQPAWEGESATMTERVAPLFPSDIHAETTGPIQDLTSSLQEMPPEDTETHTAVSPDALTRIHGAPTQEQSQLHTPDKNRLWLFVGATLTVGVAIFIFVLLQDPGPPKSSDRPRPSAQVDERSQPPNADGGAQDTKESAPTERAVDRQPEQVKLKRQPPKNDQGANQTLVKDDRPPRAARPAKRAVKKKATTRKAPRRRPRPKKVATRKPPKRKVPAKKAPKKVPAKKPPKKRTGDQLPFEDL